MGHRQEGPGKYGEHASKVLEATSATAVVLIVVGGNKGSGFSVQARADDFPPVLLAETLEEIAKEIRREATS